MLRVIDEASAYQLPALIAEWAAATDHRRWIAKALRIDLALLTERPELVVPSLYRRCATVGVLEAGFKSRPEVPAGIAELRDWIGGAVEAWGAGRRWLRALRSPPVPLDGAVVEEYRTSAQGTLWRSADGQRIGVVGEAAVAWERATGRRVQAGPMAAPRAGWEKDVMASKWGTLVLKRDGRQVEIACGEDNIVHDVVAISDRYVFVSGGNLDPDDFHGVVDVARARLVWQQPGRCASIVVLDEARCMLAGDQQVSVVAVATGAIEETWRCPYAGDLLALPDGKVAVRTDQLIRVWDPVQARAPQVEPAQGSPWLAAGFSPDGTRLVTGGLLCDARTGALIARLACNSGGWLEGGPPANCQRLCDGVFAEAMPFRLTVWETHSGAELARYPEFGADAMAAVAFDSTGRYFALWTRDRIGVIRMRDGSLLWIGEQPGDGNHRRLRIGFSSDGETLAWDRPDGTRWALAMQPDAMPRRIVDEPREPAPASITVEDGVLVVDGMAIPCDDARVVASPDARVLASRNSHYRVEGDA